MTVSIGYGIVLSTAEIMRAIDGISESMTEHEKKLRHLNMSSAHYERLSDEGKEFIDGMDITALEEVQSNMEDLKYRHFVNYVEENYPLLGVVSIGIADSAIVVKTSHQESYDYGILNPSSITERGQETLEYLAARISYSLNSNWIFWENQIW
ncbi:MAG: hypothetical protein H9W81_12550 [Enterococcus sp.]|nr:hypothetical protein [Enterococcus sp.]